MRDMRLATPQAEALVSRQVCSACGQPIPAPGRTPRVLVALLTSRKAVVLLGAVVAAIAARVGLDPALGREVAALLVIAGTAYAGTQAFEDAASKRR